jgi:RNA polymerase sigma factor (sigma-70 family)
MELKELVQRAQNGDSEAFTDLCRRFLPLVRKHAFSPHLRCIGSDAEAEGMLAVVQAVKSYDYSKEIPIAGYFESRVKYALWNLFKRERKRWQREFSSEEDNRTYDLSDAENSLLLAELKQAALLLPPKQKRVIYAIFFLESSLTELAKELKISVQAVSALKQRGLTKLREYFTG